jgi:hypothetical protein
VNNLLLDFVVQVGERGPPHRNDVPHPGMTVFPPNAEVGELVIHEVFDGRKFPAIPDPRSGERSRRYPARQP